MTKKQKVVFAVVAAVVAAVLVPGIILSYVCSIILFMGQESLHGREKHTTN